MKTIHFTNKITNKVFGYESIEVAKEYNDDFENLVEMNIEQFIDYRDNRPKGGRCHNSGLRNAVSDGISFTVPPNER